MNTVLGARKQRRLIISRTALLNMEFKIQGSVDCPLTSLCQLLMLLRHSDHNKQIMDTFMLRMSTLSWENERIAQLCKASVTPASLSWRACAVGKSNHVCPSLLPPPPKKNRNNVPLHNRPPLAKQRNTACCHKTNWNSEINMTFNSVTLAKTI